MKLHEQLDYQVKILDVEFDKRLHPFHCKRLKSQS